MAELGEDPRGAFLTDGTRLVQVQGAAPREGDHEAMVLLEDCRDPVAAFWMPAAEITAANGWRRVIPEGAELSVA